MIQGTLTLAVTVDLEFLLLEVRMALHLVHSWYNLGGFEEMLGLGDGEVGDTNSHHTPVAHELFQMLQ